MRYVPNALSLSRIPLSIALFAFAVNEAWGWAVACFSLALLTDALDGEVARHFRVESSIGANVLEPVCDLALSIAIVGGLYAGGIWPLWVPIALVVMTALLQTSHATPFTRLKRHTYYIHPLFFILVVYVSGLALFFVWQDREVSNLPSLLYSAAWGIIASNKLDRVKTWLAGPQPTHN